MNPPQKTTIPTEKRQVEAIFSEDDEHEGEVEDLPFQLLENAELFAFADVLEEEAQKTSQKAAVEGEGHVQEDQPVDFGGREVDHRGVELLVERVGVDDADYCDQKREEEVRIEGNHSRFYGKILNLGSCFEI